MVGSQPRSTHDTVISGNKDSYILPIGCPMCMWCLVVLLRINMTVYSLDISLVRSIFLENIIQGFS